MNRYACEVVRLEPCKPLFEGHKPSGWEYSEGDWHFMTSDEGRAQLADLAVLWDRHADTLSAFMDVFGQTRCAHNRPLADLEWEINTYLEDCPGVPWPWFILCGFHWDLDPLIYSRGERYCIPYEYHGGIFMQTEDAR